MLTHTHFGLGTHPTDCWVRTRWWTPPCSRAARWWRTQAGTFTSSLAAGSTKDQKGSSKDTFCNHLGLGQKSVPKMACPGKWKHGLKPAVPSWFNFDPYPFESWLFPPNHHLQAMFTCIISLINHSGDRVNGRRHCIDKIP